MRTKIWLGLAAASILAVTAPVGAAQAQSLGQNFFGKLFGTGSDQPDINYSERAPLVKPGKLDLPPPGQATTTENDPNWPNDPDEKKRKAAKQSILPEIGSNGDHRLSPAEMAKGKLNGPSAAPEYGYEDSRDQAKLSSVPLKPSELQKRIITGDEDNTPLVAGQEPARRSLTDPPPGYRKPLASAPLDGNEPLPSEANKEVPWYDRVFKTPKAH